MHDSQSVSRFRAMLPRLSLAGLLAPALASISLAASPTQVAAGAAPALLDRNVGSVMNPLVIHNLYWDTMWDADNPGMSMAQIDDATMAMISSGYFSKLAQYGVTSVSFSGSHQADPSCGTATATVNYLDLSGFILCEKHFFNIAPLGSQGVVYLVYAPQNTQFNMNSRICLPTPPFAPNTCLTLAFPNSCTSTMPGFGGFHFQTLPSLIPPDVTQVFGAVFTQCASTLDMAMEGGSHELVEAAIDPLPPFDWIDTTASNPFINGEASDLCTGGVGSPAPPPIPPTSANPQVTGTLGRYDVAYYWSNSDGACVPLPHTISLAQTGLPFAGRVSIDGATQALPFTTTVADGTFHSFAFPSPVADPTPGIRYVTSAPSFAGTVSANISETATYSTQLLLTVQTNPTFLASRDVTLTPGGWHNTGAVVSLTTDALIGISGTDRYRFDSWSGATPGPGTAATVTMTGPRTVIANYVLQHLVSFVQVGVPGGVAWSVTVNGTTSSGPTSVWFDNGTSLTFAYETPIADPTPGTRYVLTSTVPSSPIVVSTGVIVIGQYQTQHLLTVSTSGLGSTSTTISNGGAVLGTANDATALTVWLPDGTILALTASPVVTGPGGVQLFFQGFTPVPPPTLTAPFTTTASYSNVVSLITGGLASGAIDNHGVANSLITQFGNAQADIAAGNHRAALGDLRAFIQHVAAQSGQHVDPALARTLELDALLAYHEQLCAALDDGQITPSQAARDYRWYAARVSALGGTPLPPC